jgi:hypothetical protein
MGLHLGDIFGEEKKKETPPQPVVKDNMAVNDNLDFIDIDDLMERHEVFEKSIK